MHKREYLESTLIDGFLLRDHKVELLLSREKDDWSTFLDEVSPFLFQKLRILGKPWESLDEMRRNVLIQGLGSISGKIPMLCFSEVPENRNICNQQLAFGAYGLVIKRSWLDQNGADRIIYVGQNSTLSKNLFRVVANYRIANLYVDNKGQVLFDNSCLAAILELLVHIQIREHLEEFEWRIAGRHGFMGGKRDTGARLRICLDDIEYILVQKDEDIGHIKNKLDIIAGHDNSTSMPKILCQPGTIPV